MLSIAAFIVLGAALLGLLLAPPQKIPLKGYQVKTTLVSPMPNWWTNAVFTDDWIVVAAKDVSPVQLDNSTALCVLSHCQVGVPIHEMTPIVCLDGFLAKQRIKS
jgi:hypothetical protein